MPYLLTNLYCLCCRYFTSFMNMIHSLNSLELYKLGKIWKQAAISSLRDTTILAMSNMLTANIDSGLTHAIGKTAPHVLIIIAYLG